MGGLEILWRARKMLCLLLSRIFMEHGDMMKIVHGEPFYSIP